MAEDVRTLLRSAGYYVINNEPDPACCGFGGHIYNAVPALHDRFADRRTEDIQGSEIIAASISFGGTPSPRTSLIKLLLALSGMFQSSGTEDNRISSNIDMVRGSDQILFSSSGESIIGWPG